MKTKPYNPKWDTLPKGKRLSTQEVADHLGMTYDYIRDCCIGTRSFPIRVRSEKIGRVWFVTVPRTRKRAIPAPQEPFPAALEPQATVEPPKPETLPETPAEVKPAPRPKVAVWTR